MKEYEPSPSKMGRGERNHREHRGKNNSLWSPEKFPLKDITGKIIASAIEVHPGRKKLSNRVHSTLVPGLLESVYEEVLAYEFVN